MSYPKNLLHNVDDVNVGNIGHINNCVNFNSDRPSPNQVPLEKTDAQQEKQIAKIKKLQNLGLTDDEIGELLEIPLELVKSASFNDL